MVVLTASVDIQQTWQEYTSYLRKWQRGEWKEGSPCNLNRPKFKFYECGKFISENLIPHLQKGLKSYICRVIMMVKLHKVYKMQDLQEVLN